MIGLIQSSAGILLAVLFIAYLKKNNFKKQCQYLAAVLLIVAFIYVLFAAVSLDFLWIVIELIGFMVFLLLVWLAYRYSYWFVAMGWLIHIVWDIGLHPIGSAPYIPDWYPPVCVGFDIVLGLYLSYCLVRQARHGPRGGKKR